MIFTEICSLMRLDYFYLQIIFLIQLTFIYNFINIKLQKIKNKKYLK
jgi:hypothetical protein